jgi:predicted dehydrogenase
VIADLPQPRLPDPGTVPSLRWGAVGTGAIVRLFTHALHAHTTQRIRAVAARDVARTAAFATEFGIDRAHASTDALVSDPELDVVYVGTPHSSHADVALRAIAAGKHVLVEKPFALSAAEGADIAAAARAAGVFAMEAMWTRYLPQSDIVRRLLADGAIGEVDLVMADFGFVAPFDPEHRMWDPSVGGGALLDAGVYPLSFASSVIGPPSAITAAGALTSTGVDARATVQLTTPSGANALVATSMVSALPVRATIVGSAGRIDIPSPFFGPTGVRLVQGDLGSQTTLEWTDTAFETLHEGLCHQATALASYVAEGRTESPLHGLDETVSILGTIDEARRQVAATSRAPEPSP